MDHDVTVWLKKIKEMKHGDIDLSRDEDLSIALMNLISLEEHFYFSAMKTQDQKYLDMLNSVRKVRRELLKLIVVNPQGEEWCISKHLLAASMRLIEVGTKELDKGKRKEAELLFKYAFDMYSLFFALNLKLIEKKEIQKVVDDSLPQQQGMMQRISRFVKEMVDCCKE